MSTHYRRAVCAATAIASFFWAATAHAANGPAFAVTRTLNVGGDGGWDYVTLSADGKRLYVPRSTHMQVVDLESGKVVADIAGTTKAHGVALVPEANRGFITFGGDGSVVVFDLTTNKVLGTLKTEPDCDGIAFDPASKRVLLVSGDGNSLWSIDPSLDLQTGKPQGPLALGGAPESFVVDGHGKAYINLADKNQVAVVDTQAMKVLDHWSTGKVTEPVGMAMDQATRRLFVACRGQDLVVMNADNGKILTSLPIGPGVDAAGFDGQYAFASCVDGTLAVAGQTSPGQYEIVQTVKTAPGARTMTLDPQTDTLYLPTAEVKPSAPTAAGVKAARPTYLPRTFKILVVQKSK